MQYQTTYALYKQASRISPSKDREQFITETFEALAMASDAAKAANTYLESVE